MGLMELSPEKKIAGVLAPLFGLRSESDLGIGDVAVLREFIDWTAEIGLRKQFAPQLVVDLGFGHHFAGTTQGTSVAVGMSYSTPLRMPW